MCVGVRQWAESLFRELDYRKEAANGIRFKELYGNLEVRTHPSLPLPSLLVSVQALRVNLSGPLHR